MFFFYNPLVSHLSFIYTQKKRWMCENDNKIHGEIFKTKTGCTKYKKNEIRMTCESESPK